MKCSDDYFFRRCQSLVPFVFGSTVARVSLGEIEPFKDEDMTPLDCVLSWGKSRGLQIVDSGKMLIDLQNLAKRQTTI